MANASAATAVAPPTACPMHEKPMGHPSGGDISACPMHEDSKKSTNGKVFNVYMQEIDPTNNMPANPNQVRGRQIPQSVSRRLLTLPTSQKPAPGQQEDLPTKRQQSSIPKGGTEGAWLYPSEQMFYNALVRKNKSEGVAEKDMSVVVAIHNNMNETTWKKLLEWENVHAA
jgi:cytochrome c heme-lyase